MKKNLFYPFCLLAIVSMQYSVFSQTKNDSTAIRNGLINLSSSARVSSPYPKKFPGRTIGNIIDGAAGDEPDHGWTPNVANISKNNPVVVAFTWEKPVRIEQVEINWLKNWYFTNYTLASWNGAAPVTLTAPPPLFKHTDVFIGGHEGYHTYRIPAMAVSPKGTIFAFCEGRKNNGRDVGAIDLLVKRSTDGGLTWGKTQVIYGEEGEVTIGNPVPIADKAGDIHIIFCRDSKTILYAKSTDDGLTYSKPADITPAIDAMCKNAGFKWNGVWTGPGHGLECSNGRLIIPLKVSGEKQAGVSRRVGIIYSDDHGRTWLPGGIIQPSIGEMSECSAFEKADGTIVINMRWHDGFYRAVSGSADGGLTWSAPRADKQLPDPVSQGSIIRYSSGKDDPRVFFINLDSQKPGTLNRNNLTLRLSKDEGKTWDSKLQIVPGPSGYADLAITKTGKVAMLFENGTESYSDKLTFCTADPGDFKTKKREKNKNEPYYAKVVRSIMYNKNWNTIADITSTGSEENIYILKKPVVTNTLFISVSGVYQPGGYAYFQEVKILGQQQGK